MIKFDVLTLFPEMFETVLGDSIIGRARKNGLIQLNFVNIRDFSKDKHRKTDLYPYSGGGGMVMTPQPVYDAYQSVVPKNGKKPRTLYMSPQGTVFNQKKAIEFSQDEHIVIICGHYEGMDQRVIDLIVDEEISIGDFVLTGGEIPAMAVIDSVSRLIPGVLASEESYQNESHYSGLLEYPQYTRPAEFMGLEVPAVLLSGHHANIEKWKHEQAIVNTFRKRPDMLKTAKLTDADRDLLRTLKKQQNVKYFFSYSTDIGDVWIAEKNGAITDLRVEAISEKNAVFMDTPLLNEAYRQLTDYLKGKRKTFTLPLSPEGTPFQKKVWKALVEIPYGQLRSYKDIAEVVGSARGARAVGGANHNNPIMIMIPCHRVIGANGSLGGYACGLEIKKKLLTLEGIEI